MPSDNLKMLSLTGGGFRGLYTAQVISNYEKHFKSSVTQYCDCIAGTSIGGIIALALAAGKSGEEIVETFKKLKELIFAPKPWYHTWYYSCKYKNAGLQSAIKSILGEFSEATMQELKHHSAIDLLITTVAMDTGETLQINGIEDEYKNWNLVDVALATSAAPTFFPAHTRNEIRYIDGGVSCNMPDILAAQTYSKMRGIPLDALQVLSIGTCYLPDGYCPAKKICSNAGAAKWAINLEYFINLQAPLVQRQCEALFAKHRYARVDSELDFDIKLDDISKKAEEHLVAKAISATSQANILNQTALLQFWTP